jgi:hypothetical protein
VGARSRLLGEEALRRKLRIQPAPPLPPDAPPLREVVAQLVIKTRQLNALDDQIAGALATIEQAIRDRRSIGGPVDVAFPPWGKLGWSGRRGRWRLVVVDEDMCEDLSHMPRSCRAQACLLLPKLVSRLGLLPVTP